MKRWVACLTALGALVAPMASAFAHSASEHGPLTPKQEFVVTGHDELDPVLHIEAPFEVREGHCLACVLHQRQAAAAPSATRLQLTPVCGRAAAGRPLANLAIEPSRRPAPRAPPRARFS